VREFAREFLKFSEHAQNISIRRNPLLNSSTTTNLITDIENRYGLRLMFARTSEDRWSMACERLGVTHIYPITTKVDEEEAEKENEKEEEIEIDISPLFICLPCSHLPRLLLCLFFITACSLVYKPIHCNLTSFLYTCKKCSTGTGLNEKFESRETKLTLLIQFYLEGGGVSKPGSASIFPLPAPHRTIQCQSPNISITCPLKHAIDSIICPNLVMPGCVWRPGGSLVNI
jgi:hypothetical protein